LRRAEQYGDSCEVCGATYTPADLKNPVSVVSGTAPVWRESEHYFFRLSAFEARLKTWVNSGAVQSNVAHKLDEWFSQGLKDWDISRDAPYFGFQIPDAPGKYFYVWFDAPIGYLASFSQLCARTRLRFDDFFDADSSAELHHFIGKDILYFHTLFWPAVLEGAGMRKPTGVHAHGFVTINGQKMSKSRGTFITARRYLDSFSPEYLRYYFAAKLGTGIDDLDMNLEEFTTRLNSDIVGKLVNIASRCAGFITKIPAGRLSSTLPEPALYAAFAAAAKPIAAAYETRDYAGAIREIMALADRANQYIDQQKPWSSRNTEKAGRGAGGLHPRTQSVPCAHDLFEARIAGHGGQVGALFRRVALVWGDAARPLLDAQIRPYEALAVRLDPKAVARLVEPDGEAAAPPAVTTPPPAAGDGAAISIDDFARIDLRVARISRPDTSRGRTSCSSCASISALVASAKFSPASAAPTSRRAWSGASRSWLPISSRARCASVSPRAWCWPRAPAARKSFC
jgi:methionyl-tRNA synthetase